MSQQTGKTVAAWGPSTVETEGEEKVKMDLACSFVGVKIKIRVVFPLPTAGIVIPHSLSFCNFSLFAVIIFYN